MPTETNPPDLTAAIDELLGDPVAVAEIDLQARHDYLRLLTHEAVGELLELCRLYNKLRERGERLGPVDCFKWVDAMAELEHARFRYACDLRRYDAVDIIRQAAEDFAGAKLAEGVVGFMHRYRKIQFDELRKVAAAARAEGR
jgi:hypothetical protein